MSSEGRKYYPEAKCPDCHKCVRDYYMVTDRIWGEFGCGDGQMHMECLSKRMGRPLHINDFTDAPVNMKFRQGWFAAQRYVDWSWWQREKDSK